MKQAGETAEGWFLLGRVLEFSGEAQAANDAYARGLALAEK
jgi:cytochrome c-type biogenesis protein CcmH/NrfG